MSSTPQLEDGFTRLANELLEELCQAKLSSRQWCVVMALARKTYGFNKKTDDIGLSQLADLTGLAKSHVSVTVRELEERRIISRKQGKFGHIMGINKDHGQWAGVERRESTRVTVSVTVTESVTVTDLDLGVTELVQGGVTESVTTKDNPTKDTKQKKEPREQKNFKNWLEGCKLAGSDPIPEDDPVFAYAENVGLPLDFVRFAWVEFKRKYSSIEYCGKKYKSWPQHFANAVRKNWAGIWYSKGGEFLLTTSGKMLEIELNRKNDGA